MPVRPLSKELQEKAVKELNEVPERIPEDIAYIRKWLSQAKHINARMDDQFILTFLRGCKFSLERTKEKLDMFYTMKTLCPEFYKNRDPMDEEIQEILKLGVMLPLPDSTAPDAMKVLLMRTAAYDPEKTPLTSVFKVNTMIQDILMLEDDQFIVAGGVAVQDLKGVGLGHMPPIGVMKKATKIWQEALPLRQKGGHFINLPPFFENVFNMIKPLLNEKMRSRMRVHTSDDLSNLYKEIPQKLLPKEYGGEGPSIAEITEEWKKKVESYRDWFLEDEKFGTDEKKRPGRPKTSDEFFGVEGSFRKLNVD